LKKTDYEEKDPDPIFEGYKIKWRSDEQDAVIEAQRERDEKGKVIYRDNEYKTSYGIRGHADLTLFDACAFGARHPQYAPLLVKDVLEGLEEAKKKPILILMDGVNYWDADSDFRDPHKEGRKPVPSHQLDLVQFWSRYLNQGPSHGVALWSLTGSFTLRNTLNFTNQCHELYEISPWTPKELFRVLTHYKHHQFLKGGTGVIGADFVATCKGMTDGVGKELFKYVGLRRI